MFVDLFVFKVSASKWVVQVNLERALFLALNSYNGTF